MKLNSTGIAGVSLVVAAILGGAAGGALVLGDDSEAPAPLISDVGLKVADETTEAPTPAPATSPSPSSLDVPTPPKESNPVTVTNPEPSAEEPVNETPDRPKAPRTEPAPAEEPAAEAPEPTPAPTPKPTPVPECVEGEKEGIPYNGNNVGGGQGGERTCINGKWVVTKEPVDAPPSNP